MNNPSMAVRRLKNEYKSLSEHPASGILAGPCGDNIFEWDAVIIGPAETPYEGGFFKAKLQFPSTYPLNPPKMTFESEMWHPNIYPDGNICISILHVGEDQTMYETLEERWTPSQSIESILLSVMSLLASPNIQSPANIDAAKEYRDTPEVFNKKVNKTVLKSLNITKKELEQLGL